VEQEINIVAKRILSATTAAAGAKRRRENEGQRQTSFE
jgi:hypothetical protein